MSASTIGLILEIVLFAAGVYLYLFARGAIKFSNAEAKARTTEFREENKTWMRLLGLALAAVMAINIVVHLTELIG
ncbi:hypothetical protein [Neolewinella antarctica]|uniref:Membrane protein YphA (DoxX/SURF4 family) n=1 Tax=Neolewinella antarctica TaxID=442734 RepID=A0ABX0X6N0_9BACT|nr:hypothetical protein [Neolewinella antarctica]NJC24787.1 putative membrane protein YphA (DoxX/SURF4 family) [Neolewinella antarctica]